MKVLLFLLLTIGYVSAEYKFPDNFIFGVATGAVQYEGAWKEDGKGESIWDYAVHNSPEKIEDGSNGDITSDGYHKYKEDVQLIKSLGVDFYRFSISWPRILPTGIKDQINQFGVDYYNNLINELLSNGIQPHVTMYFWDLPQALQEEGGWRNRKMIDYFVDYARILFESFGDRIKNWITFNEILSICEHGYGAGNLPPFLNESGIANYECAHVVLLAHGRTYQIYNEEFRQKQQGQIGIGIDTPWFEPKDPDSEEDKRASEIALEMAFGWFLHPIVHGNYPEKMIDRIAVKSKIQRFDKSRLPKFTKEEQNILRGSLDFLGLNFWTVMLVELATEDLQPVPSFMNDVGVIPSFHPSWPGSAASWLKVTPWGLPKLLDWIKNNYNIPVIIAENGYADKGGLEDRERADYHKKYLDELLRAIIEEHSNVIGYTIWTLTDNFSWIWGYTQKFGLFSVDFNKPDRPRTAKLSSYVYKNIIATRKVDLDYYPEWPPKEEKIEDNPRNVIYYIFNAVLSVCLLFIIKTYFL